MILKTICRAFSGKSCKKVKNHFCFLVGLIFIILSACNSNTKTISRPNLIYVFADQWRAEVFREAGYQTAPEEYRNLYADPGKIKLLPNTSAGFADTAGKILAGYYAHHAALDVCFDKLLGAVESNGLGKNTVIVFTSEHDDYSGIIPGNEQLI